MRQRENRPASSMAPAAPHGKPRCWVSEGVWCVKVYDIISRPDRWQGSGVSPAAGGENFWAFLFPSKHTFSPQNILYVCMHMHIHMHTHMHDLHLRHFALFQVHAKGHMHTTLVCHIINALNEKDSQRDGATVA